MQRDFKVWFYFVWYENHGFLNVESVGLRDRAKSGVKLTSSGMNTKGLR
jgi:hypothetical protein